MPPTQSTLAHADVQAIMDRALANGRGTRTRCSTYGEAYTLRQRCYTLRKLDVRQNRKIYQESDPLYQRSVYDCLHFTLAQDDDFFYLVIQVATSKALEERTEDI